MKTKFTKHLSATVAAIAILTSVSLAHATTIKTVTVDGLNKVKVSGNVEVCLIQADNESYSIYDAANFADAKISMEGDQLNISSSSTERLNVVVRVTGITSIEANGNATVRSLNQLESSEIKVNLNDRSIASLNIDVLYLDMNVQNSASIKLSGISQNQKIAMAGNSKVDATDFKLDPSYRLYGRAKLFITKNDEKTTVQNNRFRDSRRG